MQLYLQPITYTTLVQPGKNSTTFIHIVFTWIIKQLLLLTPSPIRTWRCHSTLHPAKCFIPIPMSPMWFIPSNPCKLLPEIRIKSIPSICPSCLSDFSVCMSPAQLYSRIFLQPSLKMSRQQPSPPAFSTMTRSPHTPVADTRSRLTLEQLTL